jgi:PTS system nitrogen regulatory IIA component
MYLNLIQLAESFGVSERVVEGWIRDEGMPHTPEHGVLLFDRAQVAQWAATRGLAARAGFLAAENPALSAVLRLCPLLRIGGIWRGVAAADLPDIFARVAAALPGASPPIREMLAKRFRAKGGVTIAPIGGGYALPHPATRVTLGRDCGTMALILLRDALPRQEPQVDETPVTRLLFFIAPSPRAHLDMVGRICRLLLAAPLREALDQGEADEAIYGLFAAADLAASPSNLEGKPA